jgi:hypothetical protein
MSVNENTILFVLHSRREKKFSECPLALLTVGELVEQAAKDREWVGRWFSGPSNCWPARVHFACIQLGCAVYSVDSTPIEAARGNNLTSFMRAAKARGLQEEAEKLIEKAKTHQLGVTP